MSDELLLYCVVSKEAIALMKGNRGKLCAQAAHGFLHAYWDSDTRFPEVAKRYRFGDQSAVKVTLAVETTAELLALCEKLKDRCGVSLVTDAARTVFTEPTMTCLGVGPTTKEAVADILGDLRTLI